MLIEPGKARSKGKQVEYEEAQQSFPQEEARCSNSVQLIASQMWMKEPESSGRAIKKEEDEDLAAELAFQALCVGDRPRWPERVRL